MIKYNNQAIHEIIEERGYITNTTDTKEEHLFRYMYFNPIKDRNKNSIQMLYKLIDEEIQLHGLAIPIQFYQCFDQIDEQKKLFAKWWHII